VGRAWFQEVSDALVSVFFPCECRICDRLLTSASRVPLSEECLSSFERVPGNVCEIGRPLPGSKREPEHPLRCPACQDKTYAFDRARRFAGYENVIVRAILLLRFEQIEPLGTWLADRLAAVVNSEGKWLAAGGVVPVPLYRERERERGYNQSALLSKPLAKRLRLPHQPCFWCAYGRAAGQASAEFRGAMGICPWRFCHTSRQPG